MSQDMTQLHKRETSLLVCADEVYDNKRSIVVGWQTLKKRLIKVNHKRNNVKKMDIFFFLRYN